VSAATLDADPQRRAAVHRQPAAEGAGDHDAFDAEVEHAGAFAQQHTERAEDERRGDAQDGDPERCRGEDV
jgi:hypothetical protein